MPMWLSPSVWRGISSFLATGLRALAGPVVDPPPMAGADALTARDVERFTTTLWCGDIGADDFAR
jgi:hypothetical protein